MKLSTRFALLITALYLAAVGFVLWMMVQRLSAAGKSVAQLTATVADVSQKEREARTKLSAVSAGQGAVEIGVRAAEALAGYLNGRTAQLSDPRYLAPFKGDDQEAAAIKAVTDQALDQVILTDEKGIVYGVVPANEGLIDKQYVTQKDIALLRRQAAPIMWVKVSDRTPARLIVFAVGLKNRAQFLGVLVEVAAFENILKGVAGAPPAEIETRFMLVDREGVVALGPADLLGRTAFDIPEMKPLATAAEGVPVEVGLEARRWMAVRRPGPLEMTVIGFGAISTPPVPATAGTAPVPSVPFLVLALVTSCGLVGLLLVVILPLGRLGGLAKSAEALASGASSVEFKSAGARDEIGAAARALEKVGEKLASERSHREETSQAYATIQRDLQRVQSENRELQEYQRNLEMKARQQQAALEGEVAAARQELESARTELESTRAELATQQAAVAARDQAVAARDAAIAERDTALVQAGQHIQGLTESLAALQQSVESLSGRLAEANSELDRRRAAPAAAFRLFAEACEALSTELAGLVELVQGYIGQLVEAGAITEEQQQFLSTVITRSARSQRLMGDLRDFSNIVRPDGLAREPIDFSSLLTDVVGTVSEDAEVRGITLDAEVPALPEAMGDEGRLRQMVTVLLQNAIRFTPEGGTVSMRVGVREGMAGIRIEDSAESIPVKSEEVFDHFHPADEEIMELRGSGLRFPILRAIAGAHGGSIDLAITEQGSNLFFVRIPVRAEAPTADQTAALFAGVASGEGGTAQGGVSASAETPAGASAPASAEVDQFAAAFASFAASAPAAPAQPAEPEPAPAADTDAFAAAFASFAATTPAAPAPAEAAAESPPSGDTDAFAQAFAAFSAVPAPADAETPSAVETTDGIMAATDAPPPETPPEIGIDELWTVPGADAPAAPTVDSIEAAPAEGEPPKAKDKDKPFAFGSDDIIAE